MLDKQKLLEWLRQKRKEDIHLSVSLKDEKLVAKHEHYAYVSQAVVWEIERGTFDVQS